MGACPWDDEVPWEMRPSEGGAVSGSTPPSIAQLFVRSCQCGPRRLHSSDQGIRTRTISLHSRHQRGYGARCHLSTQSARVRQKIRTLGILLNTLDSVLILSVSPKGKHMRQLIVLGLVGLIAQLIDGSLGMAYGVTSTTLLLAAGTAPAAASAAGHFSELGTTLVSGSSHHKLGNLDRRPDGILAGPGFIGALIGSTVLANLNGEAARHGSRASCSPSASMSSGASSPSAASAPPSGHARAPGSSCRWASSAGRSTPSAAVAGARSAPR